MNDTFAIKSYSFPEGFVWGSSTSGHQIEGDNIHSDFWYSEQQGLKEDPNRTVSGKAANHYAMYKEDIEMMAALGHKAFRMTIEWSRIEPVEGQYCQEALDHYIDEFERLQEKGIKIFLTMVHGPTPKWFGDRGSFHTLANLPAFQRYLEYIVPKVAKYVYAWNVLNEFNYGTWEGRVNEKACSLFYHAHGYQIIKKYSDAPVSSAHALIFFQPYRMGDPFDEAAAKSLDMVNNEFFFHAVRTGELVLPGRDVVYDPILRGCCDFWAVNTYVRKLVDARKVNPEVETYPFAMTQMIKDRFYLEEFNPECIIHNLSRLKDKPVYITENGSCCADDDFRLVFITEYLCALSKAIETGVDVRGFLYWSLLDNYEWGTYVPQFGLVEVDREGDFHRTIKPSAYLYKDIIEHNGYEPEMLKKYLEHLPKTVY